MLKFIRIKCPLTAGCSDCIVKIRSHMTRKALFMVSLLDHKVIKSRDVLMPMLL